MPQNGKKETERQAHRTELQRTVAAQANYLRTVLSELHLDGVLVSTSVKRLKPEALANTLTVGIAAGLWPVDDIALALTVASPMQETVPGHSPILPILILPGTKGQNILADSATSSGYITGGWICESNILRYASFTKPLALDGILRMYDRPRDYSSLNRIVDANERLHVATEDKFETKRLLHAAGIAVPEGIFIPLSRKDSLHNRLATLGERCDITGDAFDITNGFVVKGNTGSHGDFVQMFQPSEMEEAEKYAQSLFDLGLDVIVERRIIPGASNILRRQQASEFLNTDHNTRVLVSLSQTDPQVVAAEVRFWEFSDKGVNVSRGADALSIEEVYREEIINAIYDVSRRATIALSKKIAKNASELLLGFTGLDIIVESETGKIYVIEANGSAVGGFGTLTKLARKPLRSIANIFYPALEPALQQNHNSRPAYPQTGKLTQIPLNPDEIYTVLAMFPNADDRESVIETVNTLLPNLTRNEATFVAKIAVYLSTAGPEYKDAAIRFVEKAMQLEPQNQRHKADYIIILLQTEPLEQVAMQLGLDTKAVLDIPRVLPEYARLLIKNGHEDEAIALLDAHYKKIEMTNAGKEFAIFLLLSQAYKELGNSERSLYYQTLLEQASQKVIEEESMLLMINDEVIDTSSN